MKDESGFLLIPVKQQGAEDIATIDSGFRKAPWTESGYF
jgi:hypothetical protein